jgi:hypothetical protein
MVRGEIDVKAMFAGEAEATTLESLERCDILSWVFSLGEIKFVASSS